MRIFEIVLPREEIEAGVIYDAERQVISLAVRDQREPRLTLKALNRIKAMRLAAAVARRREEKFLGVMYGQRAPRDARKKRT